MKKFLIPLVACLMAGSLASAQVETVEELDTTYLNWFNLDLETDDVAGASIDKLYNLVLAGKAPKKEVVVAVIDGGVDIHHPELENQIWVNDDEIPGNGIDDDKNGYVDDVHGWNFLGNASGENVNFENYEYTRVLATRNADDPNYAKAQELYDAEYEKRHKEKENLRKFRDVYNLALKIIRDETGIEVKSAEDLQKVQSDNERVINSKNFLKKRYDLGFTEEDLHMLIERNENFMKYYLNKKFAPREIVGDDPADFNDRGYGNPDVVGPRPDHGTSVAGVIAATRDNDEGIKGVATSVRIMAVRTTPDGDERDKDVALGIIYAVDNGADVINMSFGKQITPHKEFVDEAVRYAEDHNVLIVHAAGNYGFDIDKDETYPSDRYADGTEATNFINIGAHRPELDKSFMAVFSNYGHQHVDLFAPGSYIISLDTAGMYSMHDGTSVAAPVVSGVAALLLAYYPGLTPSQVIDLLMESSYKVTKPRKVYKPGLDQKKRKKGKFASLSKSGGILNAYNAFILAEEKYGGKLM